MPIRRLAMLAALLFANGAFAQDAPAPPEPSQQDEAKPTVDAVLERAKAGFAANYGAICQTLAPGAEAGAAEPTVEAIRFSDPSNAEGSEREMRLFRFSCVTGAYNTTEVYYVADDTGEVTPLHFAEPELDIRYGSADSRAEVESIQVIGFRSVDQIANSEYDPQSHTITSFAKWRGVGDTSATGIYLFRNGRFSLVQYDVDATEDEAINPETVLDYNTAP